jgi:hypothetical protein
MSEQNTGGFWGGLSDALGTIGGIYGEIKTAETEAELEKYRYLNSQGAESVIDKESQNVRDYSGPGTYYQPTAAGFGLGNNVLTWAVAGVVVWLIVEARG